MSQEQANSQLSRRAFLKICGLLALSYPKIYYDLKKNNWRMLGNVNSEENRESMNLLIPADRIPVIEYRYPGYSDNNIRFPMEMLQAQIDFFTESSTNTLHDADLRDFLNDSKYTRANSVVLRIDQGPAHFQEFSEMVNAFSRKNLKPIVFLSSCEDFSDANWNNLVLWQKRGLISIGSHSHINRSYAQISREEATKGARDSKIFIENQFRKRGENIEVIGFSFPNDVSPKNVEFLIDVGYKFALGGNLKGRTEKNTALVGDFLLPSVYSYCSKQTWDNIQPNLKNNLRSTPLISGLTFDRLIHLTSTQVTPETLEELTGREYSPIIIGDVMSPLPVPKEDRILVKPAGIILHTDGQSLNGVDGWETKVTFNGLTARNLNVHFAVGLDGSRQFLPTYRDFVNPTLGSPGFSNYISIEMCGRDYSMVVNGQTNNRDARESVDKITTKTLRLVRTLMDQYNIPVNTVLGHNQATASGKSDPGDDYMKYFLDRLSKK